MQGIFTDECFLDFVKDPEKHTLKGNLENIRDFLFLRHLPKDMRSPVCGWAMDSVRTGKYLTGWRQSPVPWNVSTMAQQAGMAALKESGICGSRTADHFPGICMDEGKDETGWADGISF